MRVIRFLLLFALLGSFVDAGWGIDPNGSNAGGGDTGSCIDPNGGVCTNGSDSGGAMDPNG